MSRKGQLWRGELAEHIEAYLQGAAAQEELLDWAVDHPFFEDQSDLDSFEVQLIGAALGGILQCSFAEPLPSRTSNEQLAEMVARLWG